MLCEWRAGGVLYIVVCVVTCIASTVSAGLYGGLVKPVASESHDMREP